ncbi:MAG: flagellar export chaperone FlgN [Phycisphaerae bacterium]|nr:flagellar export chaperone FlgN [Phycisphaerae bacterium]
MSNTETTNQRLPELLVVLSRLADLHGELLGVIRGKIEHMRTGNTSELRADTIREESLVKTISEQEGLRCRLMGEIGCGYGISPQAARRMSARRLAQRVEAGLRSRLEEGADRLQGVVREVSHVNHIATLVAQQVLHHMRCMFEAVTAADEPPTTYSPHGQVVPEAPHRLFEITG